MFAYLLRRIAATIPVALLVAVFVFSLLYLTPGDPAALIAGDQASVADIERIRDSLNLDQPVYLRFAEWIANVATGDLGVSIYTRQPIIDLVGQRVGVTLSLMSLTMLLSILVAVPLGVVSAWKHNSWLDRTIMTGTVMGFSVPVFIVGYLLAYFFGQYLRWLPVQGYTPIAQGLWPWFRSMILPSVTLSFAFIGLLARMTRATMLDVLSQDYIRTARAKGLNQRAVLFEHALKNAAVPITTVVGLGVAALIGGSVITESLFSLPGLGRMTADAILRRDYPIIQSMVLLFSFAYVLINLVIDLLYQFFDPRVRY